MRSGTTRFGMRLVGALACSSFILAVEANAAATLAEANGAILVNSGDGFKAGSSSQPLPVGTKVMANQNSEATVAYSDFCVVKVLPGQVYTVLTNSPCATGAQTVTAQPLATDYALIGAVGLGAGVGIIALASKKAASP